MLFYLCQYPELYQQLQKEADHFFKIHSSAIFSNTQEKVSLTAEVIEAMFEDMKVSHAIVKETLRLSNSTPLIFISTELQQEQRRSVTLSNGLTIHSSDELFSNLDAVHRDPLYFDDPLTFHPDRWLTSDKAQLKKMEDAWIPFGYGPRSCPGARLAVLETAFTLICFAHKANITLDCKVEEVGRISTTTSNVKQLPLKLTRRKELDFKMK
jgi:cytochrome P450